MRKYFLAAAPLVLAMLIPASSHAETDTVTYVAANGVSSANGVHRDTPTPIHVAPLGGFGVDKVASITINIADTLSPDGDIPISICQSNGTHAPGELCGDGAEDVQYSDCSIKGNKSYSGFKTGATAGKVNVFIFSTSTRCEGTGSTGTLKVTH